MKIENKVQRRPVSGAAIILFFAAIAFGVGAGVFSTSLTSFQYIVSALTILIAVLTDRPYRSLPALMRPALPVSLAAIISAVYASQLNSDDYNSYLAMWFVQIVGFIAAMLIRVPEEDANRGIQSISQTKVVSGAKALMAIALFCFFVFIGLKGIPALGSDVEQGRVDAASSGTGYIRLMAYMSVPSALILVANKVRFSWIYVAVTALLVLAMGNRSPLLYLLVPLIFLYPMRSTKATSSLRLIILVSLIAIGVVGVGTYRVISQESFKSYSEYSNDLARGDYIAVAATTFEHYAGVVPENAVLAKKLVDQGKLDYQFGSTYLTLFVTALPGEQHSLDRTIKILSGREFVGGGTPPTLMGEGYINGGYAGTFLGSAIVMWFARWFASRTTERRWEDIFTRRTRRIIYGYALTWAATGQVAGLTGASTVPLAGFLALIVLTTWATSTEIRTGDTGDQRNSLVGGTRI